MRVDGAARVAGVWLGHSRCNAGVPVKHSKEEYMDILLMIIFGLVVGVIAKLLMPGRDPGGMIITIILGVLGSLLGGFLFNAMGIGSGDAMPDSSARSSAL